MKLEECLIEICSVKVDDKDARVLEWGSFTREDSGEYTTAKKTPNIKEKSELFSYYCSCSGVEENSSAIWVLKGVADNEEKWLQVGSNIDVRNMLENDIWMDCRELLFKYGKRGYSDLWDEYKEFNFYQVKLDAFKEYIQEQPIWNRLDEEVKGIIESSYQNATDLTSVVEKLDRLISNETRLNCYEALVATHFSCVLWNPTSKRSLEQFFWEYFKERDVQKFLGEAIEGIVT